MSHSSYRIIFAGTPAFSVQTLAALLDSRHEVIAVYTQPDRPAGRGQKLTPSPVKQLALQHHLPVFQPLSLRNEEEQQKLRDLKADLMIVVAYGLILPVPVLQAPALGCINIHASLLPRWRGAAPIQRAIAAGDQMTGVTIMQMDQGLDTGDMLYKVETPITASDTSESVHDRLAMLGAEALLTTLDQLTTLTPEKQDNTLATYAAKITKEEALLDWTRTAQDLHHLIAAFNPWPVTYTHLKHDVVRIWQSEVLPESGKQALPGTIIHTSPLGIDVATGEKTLRIKQLQLPGGKVLLAKDVLNSKAAEFAVGQRFGQSV